MSTEAADDDLINPSHRFNRLRYGRSKGQIFTVADDRYLDLEFLPHGIIHKTETGIGGTTVETKARRNSIIIEPLKAIASTKAAANKNYLYVGSPTKLHDTPIDKGKILNYHNSNIEFKKIFVVADSLPKVIDAIGYDVFSTYFFLIDEIDSFQEDSVFRSSLEICMDYYKKFPENRRALISATINQFSDPELQNEPLTTYEYQTPRTRSINVISTNNVNQSGIKNILDLAGSEHKILVAYNSISEQLSIIEKLKSEHNFDEAEIGILCSESSKSKAEIHYREFENNLIPCKLTFITAAFFSGIDILEDYHLITIVNTKIEYTILSVNKLKQIAGRCRRKLISETIIFNDFMDEMPLVGESVEGYVDLAKKDLQVFECIKVLKGVNTADKYADLNEKIFEVLGGKKKYALLRKDFQQNYAISYFKIDALMEIYEAHFIYSINGLSGALKRQKNDVNKLVEVYDQNDLITKNTSFKELRINQIQDAIKKLSDFQSISDWDFVNLIRKSTLNQYENGIYCEYRTINEYVDHQEFIKYLQNFEFKSDAREFKNFIKSLWFQSLSPEHELKRAINHYFQIGESYSSLEITKLMEKAFTTLANANDKPDNPNGFVSLFNIFFDATRTKKLINGERTNVYLIKGEATPVIKIVKFRDSPYND